LFRYGLRHRYEPERSRATAPPDGHQSSSPTRHRAEVKILDL
jgi:hypothetical protein